MSAREVITLANGRSVPTACVTALDELEHSWPGATLPQARPAIAAAVMGALGSGMSTDVLPGATIIDASELDALPEGAIVRARNGHAYEKSLQHTMVDRRWLEAGNSSPERSDDIPLPATLLYP